uniref:Uncharacterized protein n=1 Tax=Fusarium oxysporum (strain Fo5176) TaxID=660025 RepID=A0A0D2XRV1_FUSOF
MALAEALVAGKSLHDSKEAEIKVDVDEEVESVIEVGVRSEDEREDYGRNKALPAHTERSGGQKARRE